MDEQLAASITVPSWLGWLSSDAAEVGLFIGVQAAIGSVIALAAPSLTRRVGLGKVYVIGLVMLGAGFGVVATMSSFWAVVPAGISIGGVSWVNIAFVTMRQRITPETMIGRVTAASRTLSYLLIPVGAAFGGVGVDTIGLVEIYLIGATVTVRRRRCPRAHSPVATQRPGSPCGGLADGGVAHHGHTHSPRAALSYPAAVASLARSCQACPTVRRSGGSAGPSVVTRPRRRRTRRRTPCRLPTPSRRRR